MFDIVIPTIGRTSLAALLASISRARGPRPQRIIVVDDRRDRCAALALGQLDSDVLARVCVVPAAGGGPAAARNVGWRVSREQWVAFLDDDVLVDENWLAALDADLTDLAPDVAASYGRVRVPLPAGRKPTDWERNVAGLASAAWITADCAYRRSDLLAAGGFDERFPRAYREDADLALRTIARAKRLVVGRRSVTHPVRLAPWWVSVRLQAGNADDVLMAALHGSAWRARAGAAPGAFGAHLRTVAFAMSGFIALAARRRRLGGVALACWLLETARFCWKRVAPGPRSADEIATLIVTSLLIPFSAVWHRLRAVARLPMMLRDRGRAPKPIAPAVLLDRDGTLIADVPLNTDPALVVPMPGACAAVGRLRAAGILTAVVSNQGAVGMGRLQRADVDAINARVGQLLGDFGPALICTHAPDDGCDCRKPRPGLIHAAASALGVSVRDCVVIGDIGADVEAAQAAGARAILVPTSVTRPAEVRAAPLVAADLDEAVRIVLSGAA